MKVNDLYKVDMLAFNSQIGYITNLGTTFYEMQSQYPVGSREYNELNDRLKLCCTAQSATIDAAKGIKTRPLPAHWTTYQKINEDDTPEEIERKQFENNLVVNKRPEFMKFLYSHYNKEYKAFQKDFDLYSMITFGKEYSELTPEELESEEGRELKAYYDKKNPLLETDGVMNKVCRHMQKELKAPRAKPKDKDKDSAIFDKLFNTDFPIDDELLLKMEGCRKEYNNFKQTKQLQSSEFSNYEQFYKHLRNKALEEISSNIQELANLAVYLCYVYRPTKTKDFCWDVFGAGIYYNLLERSSVARVPTLNEDGDIEYLGERYSIELVNLEDDEIMDNLQVCAEDTWGDEYDDMLDDYFTMEDLEC